MGVGGLNTGQCPGGKRSVKPPWAEVQQRRENLSGRGATLWSPLFFAHCLMRCEESSAAPGRQQTSPKVPPRATCRRSPGLCPGEGPAAPTLGRRGLCRAEPQGRALAFLPADWLAGGGPAKVFPALWPGASHYESRGETERSGVRSLARSTRSKGETLRPVPAVRASFVESRCAGRCLGREMRLALHFQRGRLATRLCAGGLRR